MWCLEAPRGSGEPPHKWRQSPAKWGRSSAKVIAGKALRAWAAREVNNRLFVGLPTVHKPCNLLPIDCRWGQTPHMKVRKGRTIGGGET